MVDSYRILHACSRDRAHPEYRAESESDGSLKILFAAKPNAAVPESNWLPSAPGKGFSLTLRTYVPKDLV